MILSCYKLRRPNIIDRGNRKSVDVKRTHGWRQCMFQQPVRKSRSSSELLLIIIIL